MHEDRFLTCASCGTRFVLIAAEMSADAPALCPGCRLILPNAGRQRGVVKFYNKRKGWGFVTQPDGREVFFHRSALSVDAEPFLQEGELVEYGIDESDRGPLAVEMSRLMVANAGLT